MLKPLLGETRVTWRKLDCLKSNPIRSSVRPLATASESEVDSSPGQADGLCDL